MRQFARIAASGVTKTLVTAGSAPITAVDLFFHMEDVFGIREDGNGLHCVPTRRNLPRGLAAF